MSVDGGPGDARKPEQGENISDGGAVNVASTVVSSVASKVVSSVADVSGSSVCVTGRPRPVSSLGNLCPGGVQERRREDVVRKGVPDVDGGIHDDGRRKLRMSASSCDKKSRNLDEKSRDKLESPEQNTAF